jgi:asparagine synthase (glutamine-hydrolysing)
VSGLAAIVTRDGAPASPETLSRMLDAMRERGPDGTSRWIDGPVAIGFLSLAATPEAAVEPQPFIDRFTGAVVAIDGRLDNRDDLRAALRADVGESDGDAAYVAAAYRRWGSDAFPRLIGDFAIVIWDAIRRQLVCARDALGVRPLCYAQGRDGQLLLASEIPALLATGLVGQEINEAHALEHLAGEELSRTDTLFRAIQRVEPAHLITVRPAATTSTRFWDFDTAKTVRYRDDREYADHARELFGRVVRAQSRSRSGVGVLLSGGLDSSIVTAIAVAEGVDVEAFTMTYPGAHCDESAFARAVTEFCGVRAHACAYEPPPAGWYEASVARYRDLPEAPNGSALADLRRTAAARGRRVMLSGVGGDEWFTGGSAQFADWLAAGEYRRVLAELRLDVHQRGAGRTGRYFALFGVWPVLPAPIRAVVKRVRRRNPVPRWINPVLARRHDLADRITPAVPRRSGETFAQRVIRTNTGGYQAYTDELDDRAASRVGVEPRHPFYDRRIIEFAYGIPADQRWRRATSKVVLRNMAAGLLPDVVRLRRDKAEFTPVFQQALPRFGGVGLPSLRARGWIVSDEVERLQRLAAAPGPEATLARSRAVTAIWNLHGVELWLANETRSRHDRQLDIERDLASAWG